jgi:hypothetical protein
MPQIVSGIVLSVQSELLDIAVDLLFPGAFICMLFPFSRCTVIFSNSGEPRYIHRFRADRIKAHGREDKPGRCLSIVLIPAITSGAEV